MNKKTLVLLLCAVVSFLSPAVAKATESATSLDTAVATETANRLPRKPIDPICIALYEICVNFTRNRSCDTCLGRCRAQHGNWPFNICPIPARGEISSIEKQLPKGGCQPAAVIAQ